mgnify:CR=1 FL=1
MTTPTTPTTATIVPASAAVSQTHPLWQGLKRIVMPVIAILPFVLDVAIQAVSAGTITIPKEYASAWAILMLAIQVWNKTRLAQADQSGAASLKAAGLPVGQQINAAVLETTLYSEGKLPAPPIG